jgi:hypothetical protein
MNSKLTQTEYIPLAEPILVNVINDDNKKDQINDDKEDCWGCCCLMLWYIFLFLLFIFIVYIFF